MARSDHSTPSIETAERKADIFRLRKAGLSFPAIAGQMDKTQGYIYKLYKQALRDVYAESVADVRTMELERLDGLYAEAIAFSEAFTPLVSAGGVVSYPVFGPDGEPITDKDGHIQRAPLMDISPAMKSVELRLRIMERRAKLLGIDLPTKVSMTDPTGTKEASGVVFYMPENGRPTSKTGT